VIALVEGAGSAGPVVVNGDRRGSAASSTAVGGVSACLGGQAGDERRTALVGVASRNRLCRRVGPEIGGIDAQDVAVEHALASHDAEEQQFDNHPLILPTGASSLVERVSQHLFIGRRPTLMSRRNLDGDFFPSRLSSPHFPLFFPDKNAYKFSVSAPACTPPKTWLWSFRRTTILALLAFFCMTSLAVAQSKPGCSKPRLYVRVAFVKGVEEQLRRDYPFNTDQGWLTEISDRVIRELQLRAGDVEIVPLEQAVFIDDRPETPQKENLFNESPRGEYHLDFVLGLATKRNSNLARDPSLRPSYWSTVSIGDADIEGRVLEVASFEYPDLSASVSRLIQKLVPGNLRNTIDQYEAAHFFSLRDARLTLDALPPGFVSPEPGEQKIRIKAATQDCRNRSGEGTNLWFPKRTSRGVVEPRGTPNQWDLGEKWRAHTIGNGAIEIEYQLKRGDEATRESIEVEVAGRGQKRVSQTVRFSAKTLRIEVAPERQRVAPGETTRIFVRLFKVDEKGQKEPVQNRTLTLKVTGLVNGGLRPRDKITTDRNGVGILAYVAGDRDRKVHIEASYTPQGYETTFKGEADLTPGIYTVTVDLEFKSPYVPDGRVAIADLQMHVVFDEVRIETGSQNDPWSPSGSIDASEGRGTFGRFVLQDSWTWGDPNNRERSKFLKGKEPPASFAATLTMAEDIEATEQIVRTGRPDTMRPPDKALFVFATDMGRSAPWYGNSEGGGPLSEFRLEFEAPWKDLLAGKPVTVKLPYKGEWSEDKGMWTVNFIPAP